MKINYPTLAVLSVLVLFAGLILTQPALAQAAQEKAQIAEGTLVKVDAAAQTLSVKTSKGEMEFQYTDATQISGADGVQGLATQSGAPVKVHFDGASKTATKIEVGQRK